LAEARDRIEVLEAELAAQKYASLAIEEVIWQLLEDIDEVDDSRYSVSQRIVDRLRLHLVQQKALDGDARDSDTVDCDLFALTDPSSATWATAAVR